jgi:hypothetical protein
MVETLTVGLASASGISPDAHPLPPPPKCAKFPNEPISVCQIHLDYQKQNDYQ